LGLGSTIKIDKVRSGGRREEKDDIIPREILLQLFLNGQKLCVISCSPEDLVELAAGYAVSHGYVDDYNSINIIEMCYGDKGEPAGSEDTGLEYISAKIRTDTGSPGKPMVSYLSPGCGSMDEKAATFIPGPLKSLVKIESGVVLGLNRKNLDMQKHKKALGGLHSAALFNTEGELLLVKEDIGRHNCLDKIIGYMLINSLDVSDKILFTSGRISLDLVLKAVRMKIPAVVTNSSVSYSAVILARSLGLIIIGYARGNRFNIYSCPERII
jgi:FdhD protein